MTTYTLNKHSKWQFVLLLLVIGSVLMMTSSAFAAGTPTVNGLFYGDGDDSNYIFLAENPGRGKLYYQLDGSTLYVAVVVSRNTNDNVFGDIKDVAADIQYVQDAGWDGTGSAHTFKALEKSEHLAFAFTCNNGAITDSWLHGYIYDQDSDLNPAEADWLSGPGDDSTGSAPPTNITLLSTASSLMWNLNNYASGGSPSWDMTLGGVRSDTDSYKSPGGGAGDTTVTDEVGYPPAGDITFDAIHGWEWPIVYEFSADISVCNGTPFSVDVISAHNSPPKDGIDDVPIPVFDYGDLPDSYGTTSANNGGYHVVQIGGPFLGQFLDGDLDGQPSSGATGDNINGTDDEDGVVANLTNWTDGSGEINVTVSNGDACLNVWLDFADDTGNLALLGDGDFNDTHTDSGIDEHVIENLAVSGNDPQPLNLSFALPDGITAGYVLGMRVRLTPRDANTNLCTGAAYSGGVASPTGEAIGGEIEDYVVLVLDPTAINLRAIEITSAPADVALVVIALALVSMITVAYVYRRKLT